MTAHLKRVSPRYMWVMTRFLCTTPLKFDALRIW